MPHSPKEKIGHIVSDHYGKTGVRLMRLDRSTEPHQVFEAEFEVLLEGDFEEAYLEGENRRVVPTDTVRNTIYALARENDFKTGEEFAIQVGRHLQEHESVQRVSVQLSERGWQTIGEHDSAFVVDARRRGTVHVVVEGEGEPLVRSGLEGLEILKSDRSGFSGFPRDRYTSLQETEDRILRTQLNAQWEYEASAQIDFAEARERIRTSLLDAFAEHESLSVQHTLYHMAEASLKAAPEMARITLRMPNLHCLLAKLEVLDLDNPNHIFIPTEEPMGMIEATVERAS